jgi:hypothetical protein
MTRLAPNGRPQPPRAAQHAAPNYPSTPLRLQAGRALRLLAAAGIGAAGLGAVVGAVAVVAAATGPPRATPPAPKPRQGLARQRAAGNSSTPATARARLAPANPRPTPAESGARPSGARPSGARRGHDVFAGRGSRSTGPFSIGGNGTWTLVWSYSCRQLAPGGSFVVREDGTRAADVVSVHETGTAGHGATWAYRDAGTHTLVIRSRCAWTLRVLRQSPPR